MNRHKCDVCHEVKARIDGLCEPCWLDRWKGAK